MDHYCPAELIAGQLIREHSDSVTVAHSGRCDVRDRLGFFSFVDNYGAADIVSIELDIACPIVSNFGPPDPSLLDRLFSLGGACTHGIIHNGDLSWSEKR